MKPFNLYNRFILTNPLKIAGLIDTPSISRPPSGASVNNFMDKNYCLVRYSSFDEALRMISDLFSGWPWTTNLFLCNDYIIVRLGKKC